MLDIKYVLANVEAVKQNCRNRNVAGDILDDLDQAVALEGQRRALLHEVESVRRRQNEVAQSVGKEKDPPKRAEFVAEGKRLKEAAAGHEERLRQIELELKQKLSRVPNLTHPNAPIGATEGESREIRRVGTPRIFDFTLRDHVEIGKTLD